MNVTDVKTLLEDQKVYYSLEIYPPEFYDEQFMIKKPEVIEFDKISEVDINSRGEQLKEIIAYMKFEWLDKSSDESDELPFYKFVYWNKMVGDMCRLSNKFEGWIFVVYGKNELFLDNLWIKIFRNGYINHFSNNIELEIKLKLPNGEYKNVDKSGNLAHGDYDVAPLLNPKTKGIGTYLNIFTDIGLLLGTTVANVGSVVTEAALAAKILASAVGIIDAMHQNAIKYGVNKGKCKHLISRCENIVGVLQKIPPQTLNAQMVISIMLKLQEAHQIIETYSKQWKITRFFAAKENHAKFSDINSDLSDTFYDLGVNYQVDQKILQYIE